MELVFLGTGSAYPSASRAASCIVFKQGGTDWMFDCGEGTQVQMQRCSGIKPGRLNKVFITHLHGDHLFGLPGVLNLYGQAGGGKVLEVYGPTGLRTYLRTCLALSRSDLQCSYIVHELVPIRKQYPAFYRKDLKITCENLHHKEKPGGKNITADENDTWHLLDDEDHTVKAGWLKHRIPCFGYVISEKPGPGTLDAKLLKAKGVPPGRIFGQIKAGKTITAPSGEVIKPEDVLGPPKPVRKFAILGDSCDSDAMTTLCQDCDVLVHEATLENSLFESCIEKGHSTPEMAATFARAANVKKLILTHFSQRYRPSGEEIREGEERTEKLQKQAQDVFGDDVIVAEDFLTVQLPKPRDLLKQQQQQQSAKDAPAAD